MFIVKFFGWLELMRLSKLLKRTRAEDKIHRHPFDPIQSLEDMKGLQEIYF